MSSIGSKAMLQDDILPIHKACINGDMRALNIIFKPNLIDKMDKGGNTPLILATINHRYEVAKYLLDREADPAIKNNEGYTALDYAEDNDSKIADLISGYPPRNNYLQQKGNSAESVYSESVRTYDDNYSTNFDVHSKQQEHHQQRRQQELIDADEFVEQRTNRSHNSIDPNTLLNRCDESASSDGAFSEHSQFQEVWSSQQPLSQSQLNFRSRNVERIDDEYEGNGSRNNDFYRGNVSENTYDGGGNFRGSMASSARGGSSDFPGNALGSIYGNVSGAGFRRSEVMRTSAQSRPGGYGIGMGNVGSSMTGRSITGKSFRASNASNLEAYYSDNNNLNEFQSPNPMLNQRSSPVTSHQQQQQQQYRPQRDFNPPERDDNFSYSGREPSHSRYTGNNDNDTQRSVAASRVSGIRGTPPRNPLLPPRDDSNRASLASYSGPSRGQPTRMQDSFIRNNNDDDNFSRRSQARSVARSVAGRPPTLASSRISLAHEETEHFYRNEIVPFGGPVNRSEWIEHLHNRISQLKEFIAEHDVKSPGLLRLLELSEVDLTELEAAPEGELALVKTATTTNELFDFGQSCRHDANNYDDIYRQEGQITKTEPGLAVFWDRRLSNLQFRVQRLWKSMENDADGNNEFDENEWDELSDRPYDMKITSENIDSSPYPVRSRQEYSEGYSSNTNTDGYSGPTEMYSDDNTRYGPTYRGDPRQSNATRASVQSKRSLARSEMDRQGYNNSSYGNGNGNGSEIDDREIRMRRDSNSNMSASGLSATSAWSGVGERLRGLTHRVQGEQEFVRRGQAEQREALDELEDQVMETLADVEDEELSHHRSVSSAAPSRGGAGSGGRVGGGVDPGFNASLDVGRPPKNPLRGNMSASRELNSHLRADSVQSGSASQLVSGGDPSRSYSNMSGSRASGYGGRVWDITSDLTESDTESFRWTRNDSDQFIPDNAADRSNGPPHHQGHGGGGGSRNMNSRSYGGDFDRNGIQSTRLTGISEDYEDDANNLGHDQYYDHRGRGGGWDDAAERGGGVPYTYDPQVLSVLHNQEEHHHVQSRLNSMQQSLDYSKESRSLDNRGAERRALERVSADLSVPSFSGSEPEVSRKIRSPFDSVSLHSGNRPMGGGGRAAPQEYTSIPAEKYSSGGINGALDSNIFSATQTSSPLLDGTRFRNPPQPPYSTHHVPLDPTSPYHRNISVPRRNSDEDVVRSDTVSVHRRPISDMEEASVRVASVSRDFQSTHADGQYLHQFDDEEDNGELGSPPRAGAQHSRRRVYRHVSRDEGDPEPYPDRTSPNDYSSGGHSFYEGRQYNDQDYGIAEEEYEEDIIDYYPDRTAYGGQDVQTSREYATSSGNGSDWEGGRGPERGMTDVIEDYRETHSVADTYASKRSNYSATSNKIGIRK